MLKRYILILYAFVAFSSNTFAQELDWLHMVESPEFSPLGFDQYDISVNEFGDALLMGPFANIQNYNYPFGTIKVQVYSETGAVSFEDTYGGKGRIIDMVNHGDYFYVVGEFLDFIEFPGFTALTMEEPNPVGGFLLKIHRNGAVVWVQETASILPEMSIYSIDVHSNGTLYIGAGTFAGNSKILQMNGDGEVTETWNQTNIGLVSSISVNESGDVVIAGSCTHDEIDFNGTLVQTPIDDYNIYVARYNSDGAYQWSHFMLDVTCPMPAVLLKDNGTTYFAGELPIETTLGDFDLQPLGWVYSFFYAQISEEGEVLWTYQPVQPENGIGDASLAPGQSMIHSGENVVLGGFTRGSLEWDEGVLSNSEIPGESLFMSSFQSDGHVENFVIGDDANYSQSVLSMSAGPDGSLYMIGAVYDTLQIQGQALLGDGFQLFVSRWNGETVQSTDQISTYELRHYPDPANDFFVLEGALDGDVMLVYDILGRPVSSFTLKGSKRLDVSQLPAGTYVLQVLRSEVPVYRSSIRVVHGAH